MSTNILLFSDEERQGKISIDELYERNMKRDLKQLSIFNKILNRIHRRIHATAKNKRNEQFVWFQVPSFLFGEANYDQGDCLGYLVAQLVDNGFHVRYLHPNTLYISWENFVPSYVRTEIKKKTGKIINEKGEVVGDLRQDTARQDDPNQGMLNDRNAPTQDKPGKSYTPIDQYKPSGNLVYNPEMFYRINRKLEGGGDPAHSSV